MDISNHSEDTLRAIHTTRAVDEAAYWEWKKVEHSRYQKIFNFFKKKDELESNIYDLVSTILDFDPVQGESIRDG